MAMYKEFNPQKFQQSTVYALWFRRYAPFDTFGGGTGFEFEGDHREGPSTSPKDTSRTYACIYFNSTEVLYGFSGTSGTRWVGYGGWSAGIPGPRILGEILNKDLKGQIVGYANVSLDVKEDNSPHIVSFTASTAGGNPLVPGSPDIDTTITAEINFYHQDTFVIAGEAFGDNFPNLEVFLKSSGHSAMLIDFRTSGSQDFGPVTRLWGSSSDLSLGKFSAYLPLDKNGGLAVNLN